jgi:hypothetical protein
MTIRRLATAIVAGLVVVTAAGTIGVRVWTNMHPCDVPNLPISSWRSLSCHPETALSYPGSKLVTIGGEDERSNGFEQPQKATYDNYWGLNGADQTQVETWYGDYLSNLGWASVPPAASASLDWSRGREHFVLFFLGPNDYVRSASPDLQVFSLPYQTRYWIDPFGLTIWFE